VSVETIRALLGVANASCAPFAVSMCPGLLACLWGCNVSANGCRYIGWEWHRATARLAAEAAHVEPYRQNTVLIRRSQWLLKNMAWLCRPKTLA
jgi:hypothetical protein